jgi:acyl-CoA thioester hydrolase
MAIAMSRPNLNSTEPHRLNCRVYYEDTDAGGVVYYANYLKFAERARTEWLRQMGTNHRQLLSEHNLFFTVKSVSADYHAPAKLDDLLEISSEVTDCGAATLDMRQIIRHEGKTLTTVLVTLVAVSPAGKVLRLPAALREALCGWLPSRKKG